MGSPAAEGLPPNCALIEVHVSDLKELFNSFDPTPFLKRDLDPDADEFIAGWARDLPPRVPLALVVHVDRAASAPDASDVAHQAVRDHYARRADETRRSLRVLFRTGRIALIIGLAAVIGCMLLAELVETRMEGNRFGTIVREGLVIGGWVAMWRPIEIFLYEWWPIRAEARLFDRLSRMIVRVQAHRHE